MSKSDFAFRPVQMVGSPSVQGAGGIETLATHTGNPGAHPEYMKKTQFPNGQSVTEHLNREKDHAKNYVRRKELTSSKLDYENAKNTPYSNDANNYMAEFGCQPYIITAYVLNQLLKAVGIDTRVMEDNQLKLLSTGGIINDAKATVTNPQLKVPSFALFKKLQDLVNNNTSDILDKFVAKSTYDYFVQTTYVNNRTSDQQHVDGEVQRVDGLITDLDQRLDDELDDIDKEYAVPGFIVSVWNATPINTTDVATQSRQDYWFEPTLIDPEEGDAENRPHEPFEHVKQALKNLDVTATVPDLYEIDPVNPVTGDQMDFLVTQPWQKQIGPVATDECWLLYRPSYPNDPVYKDWSNGYTFNLYAGSDGKAEIYPYTPKVISYLSRIYLKKNDRIRFKGAVDDWVCVQIVNPAGTTVTDVYEIGYTDPAKATPKTGDYVATETGWHQLKISAFNLTGPMGTLNTGDAAENVAWAQRLRFALNPVGSNPTYYSLGNTDLKEPFFFIPKGYRKQSELAHARRDRVRELSSDNTTATISKGYWSASIGNPSTSGHTAASFAELFNTDLATDGVNLKNRYWRALNEPDDQNDPGAAEPDPSKIIDNNVFWLILGRKLERKTINGVTKNYYVWDPAWPEDRDGFLVLDVGAARFTDCARDNFAVHIATPDQLGRDRTFENYGYQAGDYKGVQIMIGHYTYTLATSGGEQSTELTRFTQYRGNVQLCMPVKRGTRILLYGAQRLCHAQVTVFLTDRQ